MPARTARPQELDCPGCLAPVVPGEEMEARCACGELDIDHGGTGCERCACPEFEWDGTLACPRCLAPLDDPVTAPAHSEAA